MNIDAETKHQLRRYREGYAILVEEVKHLVREVVKQNEVIEGQKVAIAMLEAKLSFDDGFQPNYIADLHKKLNALEDAATAVVLDAIDGDVLDADIVPIVGTLIRKLYTIVKPEDSDE